MAVVGFTNGFLNAWASNNTTLPLPGAVGNGVQRVTPHSQSEALGQTAADLVSVVQGVSQMVQGGTLATAGTVGGVVTSETGVGAVAGYAVATAGVGLAAHGFNTAANGIRNLLSNGSSDANKPSEPYNRRKHYGDSPTKTDRKEVGAGKGQVADHDPPLVKRYYEGDPATGEKPGHQMTSGERKASAGDRTRMKPQSSSESNSQGGKMSQYSKQKKQEHGL